MDPRVRGDDDGESLFIEDVSNPFRTHNPRVVIRCEVHIVVSTKLHSSIPAKLHFVIPTKLHFVIPTKAGIQCLFDSRNATTLGPRVRGDDD